MATLILSSLPMFACGFWTVMIACNLYIDGRNRGRMMLMLFMAMATLLYAGHCVFLNRFYSDMPLFDSLYSFANLAVYHVLYLYCQYDITGEPAAPYMVVSHPVCRDRRNGFNNIYHDVVSRP